MTLSLFLSFVCIGYCAIELRIILHGIHKATEAKDLCGALPFKVTVVGLIPLPGSGSIFFFLSFPPRTDSAARLPRCMRVCGQSPPIYLVGLLTIVFDLNIPVVVYLAYGSTANFIFCDPIAQINIISKERQS